MGRLQVGLLSKRRTGRKKGASRTWLAPFFNAHLPAIYQGKLGKVRICCGTNCEPARSASVKPKTKNWLGLGIMLPFESGTVSRKSLSLATQRVWVTDLP